MRASPSLLVLATPLVLVACGGDKSTTGTPGPFDCLGQPLPTNAPNSVIVTGVVRAGALAPTARAGAVVKGFKTGTAIALDSTTSDASGNYTLTLATGGVPIDGYVQVRDSGYIDTYGYPPLPLSANASESVLLITTGDLTALSGFTGVTQTAGKGAIAVVVADCNGTPIAGATVSTNPAGTVRYNSGGLPSSSATSTASDGVAYVFNVTAGDVVVSAVSGANALRSHTVNARADVVTLTGVTPGPPN